MTRTHYAWEKLVPGTGASATNPCQWVLDEEKARANWMTAEVRDGVVRWRSNDRVPPQDCLDAFAAAGFAFDMAKSQRARDAEFDAFLKDYRKAQRGRRPSTEEVFEMRAAFGPGATVVDVITGQKFKV